MFIASDGDDAARRRARLLPWRTRSTSISASSAFRCAITDFKPKFTKRFAKLTEVAVTGIQQYVKEVKEGAFPDDDHSYAVNEAEYEKFAAMVEKQRQV